MNFKKYINAWTVVLLSLIALIIGHENFSIDIPYYLEISRTLLLLFFIGTIPIVIKNYKDGEVTTSSGVTIRKYKNKKLFWFGITIMFTFTLVVCFFVAKELLKIV